MASSADGTDGGGAMKTGGGKLSGRSEGDYGHTASRGMPAGGKTVSGKNDGNYGTKGAKGAGHPLPRGRRHHGH